MFDRRSEKRMLDDTMHPVYIDYMFMPKAIKLIALKTHKLYCSIIALKNIKNSNEIILKIALKKFKYYIKLKN